MFTSQDRENELRRILQPPVGQVPNGNGERDPEEQERRGRASLSLSMLLNPEIFYEIHTLAASGAEQLVAAFQEVSESLLTYLRDAGRQSRYPLTSDALQLLQTQSQLLALSPVDDLLTSPVYQQWKRESERLLRQELSAGISGRSVVLAPSELRKAGVEAALSLVKGVAELEERVRLLAYALQAHAAAPVQRDITRFLTTVLDREVSVMASDVDEQGPGIAGQLALTLLSARAAAKTIETRRHLRKYPAIDATVVAQTISADYPGSPPSFQSIATGPYHLPSTRLLRVRHRGRLENLLIGPSVTPTLFGYQAESYTWGNTVTCNPGPFTFSGNRTLELYVEAAGARYDATVEIPSGTYTDAELATFLNTYWEQASLDGFVVASGALEFNGLAGALLAVGTGNANFDLGLTPTGGFTITDDAPGSYVSPLAGPYTFVTSSTLLILCGTQYGPVSMELSISPGTISAASLALAISDRFTQLGLTNFSAFSSSDRIGILVVGSSDSAVFLPCPALTVLGIPSSTSVQGTTARNTLDIRVGVNSYGAVVAADTYSARSLALELESQLGSDLNVTAVGSPGSRTLSIEYTGPDAGTQTIRCVQIEMGTYLRFPTQERSASKISASALAGRLQEQSTLLRITSEFQGAVLERTAGTVRFRYSNLRLYTHAGTGDMTSPATNTLQLTASATSGLSVGDLVCITSDPYTDSYWSITEVTATTITAVGTITPTPMQGVSWVAGPALPPLENAVIRVLSGALSGEHAVVREVGLLEVETRTTFLSAAEGEASVGSLGLRIEGTEDSELVVEGDVSFGDLFDSTGNLYPFYRQDSPTTQWLRLSNPAVGVVAGDLWKGYSRTSENTAASLHNALVLEIEEDGLVMRTDREVAPSFTADLSSGVALIAYYRIESERYTRHASQEAALRTWLDGSSSRSLLLRQLKTAVYTVFQRTNPTPGMIFQALSAVTAFQASLSTVLAPLQAIQVTRVSALLDELREELLRRGLNALDGHLTRADFASLFDLARRPDRAYAAMADLRQLAADLSRSAEEEEEDAFQIDYTDVEEEFDAPDEDVQEEEYE